MTINVSRLFLCIAIVAGAATGLGVLATKNDASSTLVEEAISSFVLNVEPDEQKLFFSVVEDFARDNGFAIDTRQTRPDPNYFIIELWRKDAKAIAVNPFGPSEIRISFYRNGEEQIPENEISQLSTELEAMLLQFKSKGMGVEPQYSRESIGRGSTRVPRFG